MKSAGKCWGSREQVLIRPSRRTTCRGQSKPLHQAAGRSAFYWPEPPADRPCRGAARLTFVNSRAPGGRACPPAAGSAVVQLVQRLSISSAAGDPPPEHGTTRCKMFSAEDRATCGRYPRTPIAFSPVPGRVGSPPSNGRRRLARLSLTHWAGEQRWTPNPVSLEVVLPSKMRPGVQTPGAAVGGHLVS
jgi:hypothetical protein